MFSVRCWMLLPLPLPKGEEEGEGSSPSRVGSFPGWDFLFRLLTLTLSSLEEEREKIASDRMISGLHLPLIDRHKLFLSVFTNLSGAASNVFLSSSEQK